MADNTIKPSEVSEVLLQQLEGIDTSLKFDEVGTVLQVSDGVRNESGRGQCGCRPAWSY